MNLVVDIGNTLVKFAVMDGGCVVAEGCSEGLDWAVFAALLSEHGVEQAIVCSTRGDGAQAASMLRRQLTRVLEFTSETPVPLENGYRTPRTLGCDRMAAAVGAASLYPRRNVLVVDFGTAVTIDLVTADATFRGGCISAGLAMRFKALHDYTACLPLCAATDEELLIGTTTEEALTQGVMNSLTFEIEGYIGRLRGKFEDLCVIFTGGDAKFFVKRIKNTIFANRNLVFCGLDRILEHNAREEHLD